MQGYSEYEIENIPSSFPPVLKSLERCIEQVKADKERPRDHIVCGDLTLEELSGALVAARNALEAKDDAEEYDEDCWRDLAASQQKTIASQQETVAELTRLLSANQKDTAPASDGGRDATKTA